MSAGPGPVEEPVDLAAVAADEHLLEVLRGRAVSPDDPAPLDEDAAFTLLRDLLTDVGLDLDAGTAGQAGEPDLAPLLPLRPARRAARGGAVVAAVAAGVLGLGGVAAASTLLPPGSPLHGLGEAVRSAVGAVTGDQAPRATASPTALPRVAPSAAVPGPAVAGERRAPAADLARSRAAAAAVTRWLDDAQRALDAGRSSAARALLERAAARLPEVRAQDGAAVLGQRLESLQERLAAAGGTTADPRRPDAGRTAPQAPAGKRRTPQAPTSEGPQDVARTADVTGRVAPGRAGG